jgi:hypothetical protein
MRSHFGQVWLSKGKALEDRLEDEGGDGGWLMADVGFIRRSQLQHEVEPHWGA